MTAERFGGTMRCAWSVPGSRPENPVPCPKCRYISGDDWAQCEGVCPQKGSPHYDAECERVFERYPLQGIAPVKFTRLVPQTSAVRVTVDTPVRVGETVCGNCLETLDACKGRCAGMESAYASFFEAQRCANPDPYCGRCGELISEHACTPEELSKFMADILVGRDTENS